MVIGHWSSGRRQKAEGKKIYTAIFLAIGILRLIKWIYLIVFLVDRICCWDLYATATAEIPNFIVTLLL
ncbi:MAG: hypothetical protein LH628_01040 [Microcoleus sp. CAN_BIN18]|nr:hypothetical protein [Microcoleus sp. CAN_BIN18]